MKDALKRVPGVSEVSFWRAQVCDAPMDGTERLEVARYHRNDVARRCENKTSRRGRQCRPGSGTLRAEYQLSVSAMGRLREAMSRQHHLKVSTADWSDRPSGRAEIGAETPVQLRFQGLEAVGSGVTTAQRHARDVETRSAEMEELRRQSAGCALVSSTPPTS